MKGISQEDRSILVSMDFSKFDISDKCKSIEGHIVVLRYGEVGFVLFCFSFVCFV